MAIRTFVLLIRKRFRVALPRLRALVKPVNASTKSAFGGTVPLRRRLPILQMRHLRPAFFKNRDDIQVVVLRFGDIAVIGGAGEQVEQGRGGVGVADYEGCAAAVVGQHGIYDGVEGETVVGFEGQRLVGAVGCAVLVVRSRLVE